MNQGADDYITKPFSALDILDTVKSRIDKHEVINREYVRKLDELRMNISRMLPHELRTPLNAIIGMSEFISRNVDNISADETIEMAN